MNATRIGRAALVAMGLGLVLVAGAGDARAAVDVDLGAAVSLNDDVDIFLRISTRFFDAEPERTHRAYRRTHRAEDAAVALFLARHGGVSVKAVLRHRDDGLSWFQIGVRIGVPIEAYFVELRRPPGPPYGKAYGHWKKRGHPHKPHALTDQEVRDLVLLQITAGYYGMDPDEVVKRRAGLDGVALIADIYRTRHGAKPPASRGHAKARGHGKGKKP
jgi:hypothetical protein